MFLDKEKKYLLVLARRAIEYYLETGKNLKVVVEELPSEKLKDELACFVTLTMGGQLRGCIGHILPVQELYKDVIENAVSAAFEDPRFYPLSKAEFDPPLLQIPQQAAENKTRRILRSFSEGGKLAAEDERVFITGDISPACYEVVHKIKIEISVLTVPAPLRFSTPEELIKKLRPKIDGVILKRGRQQATFLPQVWEELSNPKEFLGHLCLKAGLEEECWRGDLDVETYQAEAFGE